MVCSCLVIVESLVYILLASCLSRSTRRLQRMYFNTLACVSCEAFGTISDSGKRVFRVVLSATALSFCGCFAVAWLELTLATAARRCGVSPVEFVMFDNGLTRLQAGIHLCVAACARPETLLAPTASAYLSSCDANSMSPTVFGTTPGPLPDSGILFSSYVPVGIRKDGIRREGRSRA